MDEQPDSQLLRDYAEQRNEAAFRELVRRYTDLVYSAALRQVNSPEAARDVAQEVFSDLAAKAKVLVGKSAGEASIAGWLYRSTRFLALNHRRDERRRSERERQVMQEINPTPEAEPEWERIRPVLDEAMDQLADEDREAVLLRYFKNDSLRSVGVALGVSEDAAQKRVSRAVERLREAFTKRGITIGTGGLIAVISANAVQSAPIGLALTISTAAALTGTTLATTATITATKAIAMTALQKTLVTATIAVLAGGGIYEARQAMQLRGRVQTLPQQQAAMAEQIEQLQRERDDATNRLAGLLADNSRVKANQSELLKLRGEIAQLRNESNALAQQKVAISNDPAESVAKSWLNRVNGLKERLEQMPGKKIPEMQLLTDQDWLRITSKGSFETDEEIRRALYHLREDAKVYFAPRIGRALREYVAANSGQLPGDVSQLVPYFDPPVDIAMLQRYQMLRTGTASLQSDASGGTANPVLGEKSPVDSEFDTVFQISLHGYRSDGVGDVQGTSSAGSFSANASWHYDPRKDRRNAYEAMPN